MYCRFLDENPDMSGYAARTPKHWLHQIRCSDLERPTADEAATLRTRIDAVDKKLAEIAAACPER